MKIAIVLAASCMFAELLGADLDVRAFGAKGDGVAKDTAAYNRDIETKSQFPCVFKGPLYDSIQRRRTRFR